MKTTIMTTRSISQQSQQTSISSRCWSIRSEISDKVIVADVV